MIIILLSVILPNLIAGQGLMTIGVEACDGWAHESYSSALQLQIRGVDGQTEFFIVNEESALPINGERGEFDLPSALVSDIGQIYGVQIVMEDEDGYCIAGMDISSPQYKWIVDGNDENNLDLEPECKAMTATNSNFNEGMVNGTGIGYHCCLNNGYANRHGCAKRGAYSYQQAEENCAAVGLQVCTREQVEQNRGTGMGCEFDGTLVWTSTSCTQVTMFDSAQLGNGIVIRPHCLNSFMAISDNLPLLPCFESNFDLLSDSPRGIYNLTLHTCNMDDSGLSINNMKNSLYTSIQGRSPSGASYIATEVQYLDHFASIGLNWNSLGDIAASNWKMSGTYGYFYPNYEKELSMIGLKFEAVDYKAHPLQQGQFSSVGVYTPKTAKEYIVNPNLVRVVDDGRFVVVGFATGIPAGPAHELRLRYIQYQYPMNIYVIIKQNWEDYDLPFVPFTAAQPSAKSYPDAEKYCRDSYGTSLLSIHSMDQMFLLRIFESTWGRWSWIGLNDRKNEGTFEWSDMSALDFTDWVPGELNSGGGYDCVKLYWGSNGGKWEDTTCYGSRNPICTNPVWSKDQTRTFQINTDTYMEDVVSVTLGNNNEDPTCFDEVMVNGESASYISSHWISAAPDGDNILSAIYKYPVCASEVIDIRLDPDRAVMEVTQSNAVQMSCVNHNRLISTQCGVSQAYDTTTTTEYSFGSGSGQSEERSEGSSVSKGRSKEFNWGSSSSIAYGTESTQSTSTSDTFSYGFSQELSVGMEIEASAKFLGSGGSTSFSTSFSFGANQQWTRSKEKTRSNTNSRTSTNENSRGGSDTTTEEETNSESTSNALSSSTSQDQAYGHSESFSVSCDASTDIPAGHRMDYSLIFTKRNTTVKTYTDIKLTLCSAFLNPAHPDEPQNFIYLRNVEGVLNKQETTTCNVDFAPAEALRNDIGCSEEQQMAISSGAYYIPTCRDDDSSQYTPCQCESVYAHTSPVCYCVDKLGNIMDNQMKEQILEKSTDEVCVFLDCDDFGFSVHSAKIAMQIEDKSVIETQPDAKENDSGNKGLGNLRIVMVGSIVVIVICMMAIVIYAIKCAKSPKIQIEFEDEENENGGRKEVNNIAA